MWRFHSFFDPNVLAQPAKEKAQGKGLVWAAAMCLRRDDVSLNGAWLQWLQRVSCLGRDRRGAFIRKCAAESADMPSAAPESTMSRDEPGSHCLDSGMPSGSVVRCCRTAGSTGDGGSAEIGGRGGRAGSVVGAAGTGIGG